jgi:beta-xylosidase
MAPDGTALFGQPVMVFDGSRDHPTAEGPKFYKRNGWYYIFAPAGGVKTGWQLALRSRNIFGPYEAKIVMSQGASAINGPHQGGWVQTPAGEYWFIHFQDRGAYGRVVHLNPMKWINDWPVIGTDQDGDGCGEPVAFFTKPNTGKSYPLVTPPETDEFDSSTLGMQWQWHANPQITWGFPTGNIGYYRLNCIPVPPGAKNLWEVPNLLMQKFPAETFTVTVKLSFHARSDAEETGLLVMGLDYQYISLRREQGELKIRVQRCLNAEKGTGEETLFEENCDNPALYLRVTVSPGAVCNFSTSKNGEQFKPAGPGFEAKPGRWIGAKFGLFALREGFINNAGSTDIDWVRVE